MRLVLAIGGGEDGRFLHLPEIEGAAGWQRLISPDERVWLRELRAASGRGELEHPGEVPVAGETTLAWLLAAVAEELGTEATIELVVLGLEAGVVLHAERGRGTRLEAASDQALAERLARAFAIAPARAAGLLAAIRAELLSERRLELELETDRVEGRDGGERFTLAL